MAFVAFLDSNVIWSAAVRDTLLRAAEHGFYRAAWSQRVLNEMARTLKAKRPDLDEARIDHTVGLMRRAFPEALVDGYEDLIAMMRNHEGDRHVLAAAIRAGAGVIVTWNEAHFPAEACGTYDIDIQTPDEFLCHLWDMNPEGMSLVLREQAEALLNPPLTTRQVVEGLGRSLPRFTERALRSGLV